jgi:site-specific DNA-cytosine methylase
MQITFGSVCSGIEAASVAWEPLGFRAAWLSEIAPFPSKVLAHHWPNVPNLGDMTTIREKVENGTIEAPNVFVGGTPCQSFSINGLRKGLDSGNGQLCLEYCRIFAAIIAKRQEDNQSPPVCVWENVVGALSSRDNAFGNMLAALAGSEATYTMPTDKRGKTVSWPTGGYVDGPYCRVAWRVLDAQYFGVAQRRRRVFLVASPGTGGIDPRKVLFEQGAHHDEVKRARTGQGRGLGTSTVGTCGDGNKRGISIIHGGRWRRLTVNEEERRQGFSGTHTAINGDKTPRSNQYKAIGNSMAVPVMAWIGERIRHQLTPNQDKTP